MTHQTHSPLCITLSPMIFFNFLECAKFFPSEDLYSSYLLCLRDSALPPRAHLPLFSQPVPTELSPSPAFRNHIQPSFTIVRYSTAQTQNLLSLLPRIMLQLFCLALLIDCCFHLFSFLFYFFVEQNLSQDKWDPKNNKSCKNQDCTRLEVNEMPGIILPSSQLKV